MKPPKRMEDFSIMNSLSEEMSRQKSELSHNEGAEDRNSLESVLWLYPLKRIILKTLNKIGQSLLMRHPWEKTSYLVLTNVESQIPTSRRLSHKPSPRTLCSVVATQNTWTKIVRGKSIGHRPRRDCVWSEVLSMWPNDITSETLLRSVWRSWR